MRVRDLIEALNLIAPPEFAEPWDRVGLHVGRADAPIDGPIVLTIDLTEPVLDEAIRSNASAIVAYHPPIWKPLERLTDDDPKQRIVLRAAETGIAIYSPHTALDAAPGGVTDWLCEGLSGGDGRIAGDCRALTPLSVVDRSREVKIVTFVPADKVDEVRNAMATGGAGIIGAYRLCSFNVEGEGTFFAGEGANPRVGRPGQLERTQESRFEMVCSRAALALVLETLRRFHPYEEPAIDVYELGPEPMRSVGAGRRLVLDQPATMQQLGDRLKTFLDRSRVRYALAGGDRPFTSIGVVPGAGAGLIDRAMAEGCEVFVTGEMSHHEVVAAIQHGISVLLAGHTNTERGYLPRLAARLGERLPDADIRVSEADTDILRVM